MTDRFDYHFSFSGVTVIESLRDGDRRTGEELYSSTICPLAQKSGLHHDFIRVENREALLRTLSSIATDSIRLHRSPVLHLEMHGTREGLTTSDGSTVTWDDLREPLTAINVATRINLAVTLATCYGERLVTCLNPTLPAPLCLLVGTAKPVWDSVVSDGFRRFFEVLLVDFNGVQAWRALNDVGRAERQQFGAWPARYFFRHVFKRYCQDQLAPEVVSQRTTELLDKLEAQGHILSADDKYVRSAVAGRMQDISFWLEHFSRSFFMLDRFPENADRFRVTLDDIDRTEFPN